MYSNSVVLTICAILFSISFAMKGNSSKRRSSAIIRQEPNEYDHLDHFKKNKLILKVYYESLCPASVDFFTKQLEPAVQSIGSYFKVMMYPYGNAETKFERGSYKFTCQHGPKECYGNKIHACAIDIIKNSTKAVFYNTCLLKYSVNRDNFIVDFSTALNWCGYKYKVPIRKVWGCANSRRGNNLLKHYGQETQNLGVKYVPYVLLDNSLDIQDEATARLMATICQLLDHPPPVCETYITRRSYKMFGSKFNNIT